MYLASMQHIYVHSVQSSSAETHRGKLSKEDHRGTCTTRYQTSSATSLKEHWKYTADRQFVSLFEHSQVSTC